MSLRGVSARGVHRLPMTHSSVLKLKKQTESKNYRTLHIRSQLGLRPAGPQLCPGGRTANPAVVQPRDFRAGRGFLVIKDSVRLES